MKKYITLITFAMAAMIMVSSCGTGKKAMVCPPALQEGDLIALTCPASHINEKSTVVAQADSVLRSWGYRTVCSDLVYQNWRGAAGTVEQRRDELMKYIRDPEVKCIMAITGGFGSVFPMIRIPKESIQDNPKWVVGYSDITSMLNIWGAYGIMSIHGNGAAHILGENSRDETATYLRQIFKGEFPTYTVENKDTLTHNIPGHATGRVFGGNIETLMPVMGTEFDPFTRDEDLILFIEDTNENLIHIERRIAYFETHGLMSKIKGVICGNFRGYSPGGYQTMEEMMNDHFSRWGIPVIYNFPAGHKKPNYPIVIGSTVTMDVTQQSATVSFSK